MKRCDMDHRTIAVYVVIGHNLAGLSAQGSCSAFFPAQIETLFVVYISPPAQKFYLLQYERSSLYSTASPLYRTLPPTLPSETTI